MLSKSGLERMEEKLTIKLDEYGPQSRIDSHLEAGSTTKALKKNRKN